MNSMKFYGITDKITKIFLNGKEVTDYSQKENVIINLSVLVFFFF
jgi:hypothetical protein